MSSTGQSLVITMVNSPPFVETKQFLEVSMFLVTLLPLPKSMILESTTRSSTSPSISTLLILGVNSYFKLIFHESNLSYITLDNEYFKVYIDGVEGKVYLNLIFSYFEFIFIFSLLLHYLIQSKICS